MLLLASMILSLIHFGAALHVFCMAGLVLFGFHRIWLLTCRKKIYYHKIPKTIPPDKTPRVTIQLPMYNESRVARRVIDAAAKIQWPLSLLDIQILDDSTDETRRIVDERAAFWKAKGCSISVIRRIARDGYKAGALANGLKSAKGEFIAIFDADFVPQTDFLEQTIPFFSDATVGMVQTRWGFLNADFSWLTRIQALLLSSHFRVEHQVRFSRSLFFNFNGTAGVWRRSCLESSGGWESDTVTEDLDISYRAQLTGWRFVYEDCVVVPSELPVSVSDFRRQQQRWSKGSIQTARKILPLIISSHLPISVKIEAAVHLLENLCWLFVFIITLTLYPLIITRAGIGPYHILRMDVPVFIFSGGAFLIYYLSHALSSRQKGALLFLPFLPAFSIGLSPSLAVAVFKGLFINGGRFIRTPKLGIIRDTREPIDTIGAETRYPLGIILNLLLILYTLAPIHVACQHETWLAIPFFCQFPLGFFLVTYKEVLDLFRFLRPHYPNHSHLL